MNKNRIMKSNQEQAVASWANYLNQVRLIRLLEALQRQDQNWESAIETLNDSLTVIKSKIIERNRGGLKGMHGFIAEAAECGIGNAREQVRGRLPVYEWINDNGPADLLRNGIPIQQKFVNSGNHLSLQAILQHLEKYPDFLEQGGKYQIPEDHYEQIRKLLSITREQANKIPTSNGEFSLRQWKEVHDFFDNGQVTLQDIEPSVLNYPQVQMNKIDETIQSEKIALEDIDRSIRNDAYEASKPSLEEGIKLTVASAFIEGAGSFVEGVVKKRREGRNIRSFDLEDWKDVFKESGVGMIKGEVRGISIYALTNYTVTPAAVANSLCTASFGVAEQAYQYRKGMLSEEQFLMNSEILCLEASVSALATLVGQAIIPIPVLGAVIGNTVGSILFEIAKSSLSKNEQILITSYIKELIDIDTALEEKNKKTVDELNKSLETFFNMIDRAFSPNYEEALNGSVILAINMGVSSEMILKSTKEIDSFFLD